MGHILQKFKKATLKGVSHEVQSEASTHPAYAPPPCDQARLGQVSRNKFV